MLINYLFKKANPLMNLNTVLTKNFATQYIASIDQSTTSTKFSVFQKNGRLVDKEIIQHKQITPHDGWLQHDPIEILNNTHQAINNVIERLKNNKNEGYDFSLQQIQGIGICNQRQTVICWDQNGEPLYNAIVWCDSRTKQICQDFKKKYGDFKLITGLPVSSYFTLFKIIWLIQSIPEVKEKLLAGKIKFGTVDTWIIYNLTGRYVTDASNASRTHLCNLNGDWDQSLLKLFKIKKDYLPEIASSFENVGEITSGSLKGLSICSVMGDQQSSSYAHGLSKNQMKITYGTGCFLLSNIGKQPDIHDSFVTTILNKKQKEIEYAYEASVQCGGGTLNWAKRAQFLQSYQQLNDLPKLTSEQLFFYPSFGSIFAPYWQSSSAIKGTFSGINFNTSKQNLLQAILESITFRLYDNIKSQEFKQVKQIVVDGGMTINKNFMQLQADTFNKKIIARELDTCWGVAKGVLVSKGIEFTQNRQKQQYYQPNEQRHKQIVQRYNKWKQQRNRIYGWNNNDKAINIKNIKKQ